MIELAWGAATNTGRVREVNQDQFLANEGVFVVADGMGGHLGGEVASAIAVEEMTKASNLSNVDDLIGIMHRANREIVDRAHQQLEYFGMGTTLVALVVPSGSETPQMFAANVGDSRLYVFTPEHFRQLSEDHSLVNDLLRDGVISREQAEVHPQRNVLTRALGIEEPLFVDTWELVAVAGDRYLLCSDGLTNELSDTQIAELLDRNVDPQKAASALVQAACEAGGQDNVTVVVVNVLSVEPPDTVPPDTVPPDIGTVPPDIDTVPPETDNVPSDNLPPQERVFRNSQVTDPVALSEADNSPVPTDQVTAQSGRWWSNATTMGILFAGALLVIMVLLFAAL